MKMILTRKFTFDSAQALTTFPEGHKCRQMHGHTFILHVSVKGEVNRETGIVFDHAEIADKVKPLVNYLDHKCLNDLPGLEVPSLENMLAWFWDKLIADLPGLYELQLFETPTSWCTYRGEAG
ncbi:MAG: 6-carboxytetrahydropterin synthase [Verrucomicrobiota bacterium]